MKTKIFNLRAFLLFLAVLGLFLFLPLASADTACDNDGICDSGEDKCQCPGDCGECTGDVPNKLCMKYTCATGLCRETMVYSCCGNNICEAAENFANCSRDCPPKEITIEMLSPDSNVAYKRGDSILFKLKAKADTLLAIKANARVDTFVGGIVLYDDGNHDDNSMNDGIYGFSFLVPESTPKGDYASEASVEMRGVTAKKSFTVKINPFFDLSFETDKNSYVLGDEIFFSGFVSKEGKPLRVPVTFSGVFDGRNVFEESSFPDENGYFSFSEHTSEIQPVGKWVLAVSAKDQYGNEGHGEKQAEFKKAASGSFLEITFLSPSEKLVERGKEITILANIASNGLPVSDANAVLSLPNNFSSPLREVAEGRYVLVYTVPIDFPTGEQKFTVKAQKDVNGFTYSGSSFVPITIDRAAIRIEFLEPKRTITSVGEELNFRVRASFSNDDAVKNAKAELLINDTKLALSETEEGVYSGSYVVQRGEGEKANELISLFRIEDSYGNSAEKSMILEISSAASFDLYLRQNPLIFASIAIIAVFAVLAFFIFQRRKARLGALGSRKQELIKLREELQDRYFNEGTIGSEEFYELLGKYTSELREIESTMESLKRKGEAKEGEEEATAEQEETHEKKEEKKEYVLTDEETPPLFKIGKAEREAEKKEEEEETGFGLFRIQKKKKGEEK